MVFAHEIENPARYESIKMHKQYRSPVTIEKWVSIFEQAHDLTRHFAHHILRLPQAQPLINRALRILRMTKDDASLYYCAIPHGD